MKINKLAITLLVTSIIFVSCTDNEDIFTPEGSYAEGILISGEGSGANSGTISFVSNDFSFASNFVYKTVNNSDLGIYLQSMAFDETNAYISVDNTSTITAVNRYTFVEAGKIQTGLDHPRYMTVVDGIGYSTNWGSPKSETDDYIAVIDLSTFKVTSTIPVDYGPERIVAKNGKLYVSHLGGFGTNNIVSVIDIQSKVVTEITVDDNPDELFFDDSNNLVVLCSGNVVNDYSNWPTVILISQTPASITKINTSTNTIASKLAFPTGDHPSLLVHNGNTLYYYLKSKVYTTTSTATELPTSATIETGAIYGMEVRNNQFFTVNSSFSKLSELSVYDLTSKEKTNTFNVALGASKIYFN